MARFTLCGSPHSLPTYKVALMLRLSGAPFSFRYVSFQRGMHKTLEFLALSRWGQVPVLVDNGRVHLQSGAIVEHLSETLGRFQGPDRATRQSVREWLYWDVDALFPPVFGCYAVQLADGHRACDRRRPSATDRGGAGDTEHPPRRTGVSVCRRTDDRRSFLLRRCRLCGGLLVRAEPLDECG
ncbi:MAG: glutathione S-transferase N-terminal domain-containing protein [Hyphomonadaceae bacterium]|nr:glutathione S-transferase N-terminal domain-containing protein [Hyphomonadaceae bacterium]